MTRILWTPLVALVRTPTTILKTGNSLTPSTSKAWAISTTMASSQYNQAVHNVIRSYSTLNQSPCVLWWIQVASPLRFVDSQTAALMTGRGALKLRPLAQSDLKERFTDFNGNPVHRRGYIEVPVQCGELTTPKAKFCPRRWHSSMSTAGRQHATHWPRLSSEADSFDHRSPQSHCPCW